jgi:hypothetical protein
MNKPSSRSSAARRTAEALLNKAQKREASFKLEQEREHEAIALKTARLRELRLAKEAEDAKLQPAAAPSAPRAPKPRRSKQT